MTPERLAVETRYRRTIVAKLAGACAIFGGLVAAVLVAVPSLVAIVPGVGTLSNPGLSALAIAVATAVAAATFAVVLWLLPLPGGGRERYANAFLEELETERRASIARILEDSSWLRALRIATHGPSSTAALVGACGTALIGISVLPTPWPAPLAFLAGIGFALDGYALAVLARLPVILDSRGWMRLVRDEAEDRRPTGRDLLAALRESSTYRRQDRVDLELPGSPLVEGTGLGDLMERFPAVRPWLARAGIRFLTAAQTTALRAILTAESDAGARMADFVLQGWPGSGRSTLVNLIALGTMLGREGTVYCVSADSGHRPEPHLDPSFQGESRNAAEQLRHWVRHDPHMLSHLQGVFEDDRPTHLDWHTSPSVLFTDVRVLTERLLEDLDGDATHFIERLRYVVLDHPDQLSRVELIRLRLAVARLRLAAEMLGRRITFFVLLPPLDNAVPLAKWLLNNSDCSVHDFDLWCEPIRVIGWQPPMALENPDAPQALFIREPFLAESRALLAELVFQAQQLYERALGTPDVRPMRIGVIDALATAGPEARADLASRVRDRIKEGQPHDAKGLRLDTELRFLSNPYVATHHARTYDLLISLAIGPHPERMVMSLRGALAEGGLLMLLSDGSPDDVAGMRKIGRAHWDPACPSARTDVVSVLVPDHAPAVLAGELALTLEQLGQWMVPQWRLPEVFPSREASALTMQWLAEGRLRTVEAFHTERGAERPEKRTFLQLGDASLFSRHYRIPWGCTTAELCSVRDDTAGATSYSERREITGEVDAHRLFLDLYPGSVQRFPPNSLHVRSFVGAAAELEATSAGPRPVRRVGEIHVVQPGRTEALRLDRRRARSFVRLLADLPAMEPPAPPADLEPPEALPERQPEHAVCQALGLASERSQSGISLGSPHPSGSEHIPELRVVAGLWEVEIDEQLRDVVATGERLVEDPSQTAVVPDARTAMQSLRRRYRCSAAHVLLVLAPRTGAPATGPDARAGAETPVPAWAPVFYERSAVTGLARMLARYLGLSFLRFDQEFAVEVVPWDPMREPLPIDAPKPPDPADGSPLPPALNTESEGASDTPAVAVVSPWRILVRRKYADEQRADPQLRFLQGRDLVEEVLPWIVETLEGCTCDDGCAACCGGLGYVTAVDPARDHPMWRDEDVVSRSGAYILCCELLGRSPRWDRYHGKMLTTWGTGQAQMSESELALADREIRGTAQRKYVDGVWAQLFGTTMPLDEMADRVAPMRWGDDQEFDGAVVGFYRHHPREIVVKRAQQRFETRSTIVHECAHNWQFESDRFDREELHDRKEMKPFFEGNLVIEGHASWSEQMYRAKHGLPGLYRLDDHRRFDKYKTGYLLIEQIWRAFGERGLFLWLRYGNDFDPSVHGPAPRRSSGPFAGFPFTVTEALQACGLYEQALGSTPVTNPDGGTGADPD